MLSKSQIQHLLRGFNYKPLQLDVNTLYVPVDNRVDALRQIHQILANHGGKPVPKSSYSNTGAVAIGLTNVVVTRLKYSPSSISIPEKNNSAVANRMMFGMLIQDVLDNTLRPMKVTIKGGKTINVAGVTSTQFTATGVNDFSLMNGTRKFPIAIHPTDGVYRHKVGGKYLDLAMDALVSATESGDIEAEMAGNRMHLFNPVVFKATSPAIRELMFQDIRGGVGVIGNFSNKDFSYDGVSNTLTIKALSSYHTQTDLKGDDAPYFMITSVDRGKIGDLSGLQLDLVPWRVVPKSATLVNV